VAYFFGPRIAYTVVYNIPSIIQLILILFQYQWFYHHGPFFHFI